MRETRVRRQPLVLAPEPHPLLHAVRARCVGAARRFRCARGTGAARMQQRRARAAWGERRGVRGWRGARAGVAPVMSHHPGANFCAVGERARGARRRRAPNHGRQVRAQRQQAAGRSRGVRAGARRSVYCARRAGAAARRAWRALQRSGVLAARGVAARARADERSMGGCRVVRITADMRRCALASCGEPEMHAKGQFKLCAACKTVAYCCKAHQAEDWAAHKAACKAARGGAKGAAGANEGGGAGPSNSAGGAK
jgi:hypothetical protein